MSKFNLVYNTLKELIKEDKDKNEQYFFIDINVELINEKYAKKDKHVTYDYLDLVRFSAFPLEEIRIFDNAYFGLNPFKYEFPHAADLKKSLRIQCKKKQILIEFLKIFIKDEELDYVCSFIRSSDGTGKYEDVKTF